MVNLDWQKCEANSSEEQDDSHTIHHTIYKRWLIHDWTEGWGFCIVPLESPGAWNVESFLERFPFWERLAHVSSHDTCGKAAPSTTSIEADKCLWADNSSIEDLLELLDRTEREAWEQARVAVREAWIG